MSDYVRPLRAGRLLDGGPRQAARFISLIPHEQSWSPQVGSVGSQAEVWSTRHALLSRKKGVGFLYATGHSFTHLKDYEFSVHKGNQWSSHYA